MEQVDTRLGAAELAIAELRARIEELDARLAAERTRIRTMRQTVQCPSCGGRRILHVRALYHGNYAGMAALSLIMRNGKWTGPTWGDPMEAYACRNCGLVEWHAGPIERLTPDGENIIELVGDEPTPTTTSPYR